MKAGLVRLAVVIVVVACFADLAGLDCSQRPAGRTSSGTHHCGACVDGSDCLCCSVSEEAADPMPARAPERVGAPCCLTRPAMVEGFRPAPYRPPLSPASPPAS